MPYNSLIDRSAADALIPTEYATEIVKATVQQSAALQLCRRATMQRGQQRMPVLSVLPASYWVDGDTGLKQTTSESWSGIYLNSEEIASITPVPESVIADSSFDIWNEVKEAVGQSIAQLIDQAVFSGVQKPASWPEALIPTAVAAGNVLTADSLPAEGGLVNDLANLLGVVEADGFEPSGYAASRALKPLLRSTRATTGEPLLGDQFTLDNVWSTPIAYAVAGTMGTSLALAGDWSCAILGVRQDLTYKILDQAIFQDDTGKITLNLAQQDALGLRVTMRIALAVGTPATLIDSVSGPTYPFAVLNPGAGATAAAKGAKK